MTVPDEFVRLSHCFIQDKDEYEQGINDMDGWIKQALILTHLSPKQVQTLKDFLDKLLAQSDDKVLDDAWRSTGPNYFFSGTGAMRRFLSEVRRLIDTVHIPFLPDHQ
jgi:hypothetical protein